MNIPKTANLETIEILLKDRIITIIDNKVVIIIANHGVYLFLWIFENDVNKAPSFAIP